MHKKCTICSVLLAELSISLNYNKDKEKHNSENSYMTIGNTQKIFFVHRGLGLNLFKWLTDCLLHDLQVT